MGKDLTPHFLSEIADLGFSRNSSRRWIRPEDSEQIFTAENEDEMHKDLLAQLNGRRVVDAGFLTPYGRFSSNEPRIVVLDGESTSLRISEHNPHRQATLQIYRRLAQQADVKTVLE